MAYSGNFAQDLIVSGENMAHQMAFYRISLGSLLVALVAFQQSYAINSIDQNKWKSIFCEANICYFDLEDEENEPCVEIPCQLQQHEQEHYLQYSGITHIHQQDLVYEAEFTFPEGHHYFNEARDVSIHSAPQQYFPEIHSDQRSVIAGLSMQLRI